VARTMGLGFPGGRVIDELARQGNRTAIRFPRARLKARRGAASSADAALEFSFSGLKTAVWQYVRDHAIDSDQARADVAASFQEAAVDMLLDNSFVAVQRAACNRLVIAGGVSANSRLRERAHAAGADLGVSVHIPPMRYCTDNAAMIALAAEHRLRRGESDPLSINAAADLEL